MHSVLLSHMPPFFKPCCAHARRKVAVTFLKLPRLWLFYRYNQRCALIGKNCHYFALIAPYREQVERRKVLQLKLKRAGRQSMSIGNAHIVREQSDDFSIFYKTTFNHPALT